MREKATGGGVGFLSLLLLLFLGLKLGGWIDWSWWWVFAPIWIPVVLILAIIGGAFLWAVAVKDKGEKK